MIKETVLPRIDLVCKTSSVVSATAMLLLANFSIGMSGAVAGDAELSGPGLLQATPERFCLEAQRVVSRTKHVGEVTIHAGFYDFVKSKSTIEPYQIHGYVWKDRNDREVAISCKLKSADHINAVFGAGAAGPDALCQDMNRVTYHQILKAYPELAGQQVVFDENEDVFNDDNPPSTGRLWLEPFELAYPGAEGELRVSSRGFRVDWEDERFAASDSRVRGLHYCHFIDPEYLLAILSRDAEPGATVGRPVYPAATPGPEEVAGPPARDPLKFSIVKGFGGVPINVVEAGKPGAPGILFLHGFSQTLMSFDRQLRDSGLSSRFHLVAFDLRGHGNSGKPWEPDDYSSRAFAEDVHQVMVSTGLEKPVIVAWSFGGLVALDYVRHFGAEQLGGLNFVGTAGRLIDLPASGSGQQLSPNNQAWIDLMLSDSIVDNISANDRSAAMLVAREMPDNWKKRTRNASMTMPAYVKKAIGGNPGTNADIAESIDKPILFSAGALDRISPLSAILATSTMMPQTSISVYSDSGHSPFAEDPERFNRELAEFVSQSMQ